MSRLSIIYSVPNALIPEKGDIASIAGGDVHPCGRSRWGALFLLRISVKYLLCLLISLFIIFYNMRASTSHESAITYHETKTISIMVYDIKKIEITNLAPKAWEILHNFYSNSNQIFKLTGPVDSTLYFFGSGKVEKAIYYYEDLYSYDKPRRFINFFIEKEFDLKSIEKCRSIKELESKCGPSPLEAIPLSSVYDTQDFTLLFKWRLINPKAQGKAVAVEIIALVNRGDDPNSDQKYDHIDYLIIIPFRSSPMTPGGNGTDLRAVVVKSCTMDERVTQENRLKSVPFTPGGGLAHSPLKTTGTTGMNQKTDNKTHKPDSEP